MRSGCESHPLGADRIGWMRVVSVGCGSHRIFPKTNFVYLKTGFSFWVRVAPDGCGSYPILTESKGFLKLFI